MISCSASCSPARRSGRRCSSACGPPGTRTIRYAHGVPLPDARAGPARRSATWPPRSAISSQAVSKTVAELEALGYVERRPDRGRRAPPPARADGARARPPCRRGAMPGAAIGEEPARDAIGPEPRGGRRGGDRRRASRPAARWTSIRARRVRPAAGGLRVRGGPACRRRRRKRCVSGRSGAVKIALGRAALERSRPRAGSRPRRRPRGRSPSRGWRSASSCRRP